MKKYLPRVGGNAGQSGDADMNYSNNFRVYRYAETLLNAAELLPEELQVPVALKVI